MQDSRIETWADLKDFLACEKGIYSPLFKHKRFYFRYTHQHQYMVYRYVRMLRISEYLINTGSGNPLKKVLFWFVERRRNNLGNKLGICINQNVFDKGLLIDHIGSIVVNPFAKVGRNCHIHGSCCIGKGGHSEKSPIIGNNVNLGWGCVIMGDISVADGVRIGANSVVTHSIEEKGSTWVGAPAKCIRI